MTKIIHAATFGSVARGADDEHSDLDVIAVVDTTVGIEKSLIEAEIQPLFNKKIGLSLYGRSRICQLWLEGSPFAWHLFTESIPLLKYSNGLALDFGSPSEYTSARSDIKMMSGIMESASKRIELFPPKSHCYEAGLLYVAARNSAMYASKYFNGKFDFSRFAPYSLKTTRFPLSLDEYSLLVACRHATTRGYPPPQLDVVKTRSHSLKLLEWSRVLMQTLCKE
ncbi:nucleotidyltransferase domain-containing protein [Xanthomonas arboricola]|uniref:nucleotidyltransferase domain-containing protein n=1 Tax=Xanthomonas arboricola TaxID=56448 RepID=UPI0011B031C7|nr:nucleotidyltransferase domain-containing protein [Xanthomonas arboricola]